MGALLDVFVHKAKEECMCDLLTIFLHDADKDELIARWATAFPSDFSQKSTTTSGGARDMGGTEKLLLCAV